MKKILMTLLFVVLVFSMSALSADRVSFNVNAYSFLQKGVDASFGYSFKVTVPTGIDATSIKAVNQFKADTTYTFQLITETEIIYSDFEFEGVTEVEAKAVSLIARKTLGFVNFFVDAGMVVWHFSNTAEGTSNKTYDGYYAGVGTSVFGFDVKAGSHFLPINGEDNLLIPGIGIGYKF